MRKLITITITVGTLNSDYDYDYDYAIADKIGVIAITITYYDCNQTDPCTVCNFLGTTSSRVSAAPCPILALFLFNQEIVLCMLTIIYYLVWVI